jgi:hypothetical protein
MIGLDDRILMRAIASWEPLYNNDSFQCNQDTGTKCFCFNNDGTKLYFGGTQYDRIFQFSLSTAWDVSTASYDSKSFYVQAYEADLQTICFSQDGSKLYLGGQDSNELYQFSIDTTTEWYYDNGWKQRTVSTWDVSTASYDSKSLSVSSLFGVTFKSDGTKLYYTDFDRNIYQYSLSTAWDISTASYDSKSFYVTDAYDYNVVTDISFLSDGIKVYVSVRYAGSGAEPSLVHEIELSTAWDISTGSIIRTFYCTDEVPQITGVKVGDSDSKLFLMSGYSTSIPSADRYNVYNFVLE